MPSCEECGIREVKGLLTHRPACSKGWSKMVADLWASGGMRPDGPLAFDGRPLDWRGRHEGGPPFVHTLRGDGDPRRAYTVVDLASHAERGRKGGAARAARLTPEQRRESARKAAKARWAKP